MHSFSVYMFAKLMGCAYVGCSWGFLSDSNLWAISTDMQIEQKHSSFICVIVKSPLTIFYQEKKQRIVIYTDLT